MVEKLNLLDEKVLKDYGSYKRVRRWYEGWHPEIPNAVLINNGWRGKETRVDMDVIYPIRIFEVKNGKGT